MTELPLETSSEHTEKEYQELLQMLKWSNAVLSVLLEEAGGVVEIDKEVLHGIDLNKVVAGLYLDEERNVYVVEGVYEDEAK